VQLDGHASALAGTLSGGQRKLLDLVRALMAEPRILLLDEPIAGVSPALRVELLAHILGLRERERITLLIAEHDLDFVMRACDRVIVMNDGRVIAQGTPEEIRRDERVIDAYLGARHQ
jgi:branched-chain amino acid transport system ATP-binding protein